MLLPGGNSAEVGGRSVFSLFEALLIGPNTWSFEHQPRVRPSVQYNSSLGVGSIKVNKQHTGAIVHCSVARSDNERNGRIRL